jgi:hypothetical protein
VLMQIGLEFFDLCIRMTQISSPGNKRSFFGRVLPLSLLFYKGVLIPISSRKRNSFKVLPAMFDLWQ